jgi:hypothetical protein
MREGEHLIALFSIRATKVIVYMHLLTVLQMQQILFEPQQVVRLKSDEKAED